MDPPVQIGQYVLGKNLGIGAFGKVSYEKAVDIIYRPQNPWCQAAGVCGWDCGEAFPLFIRNLTYRLEVMVASVGVGAHTLLCSSNRREVSGNYAEAIAV